MSVGLSNVWLLRAAGAMRVREGAACRAGCLGRNLGGVGCWAGGLESRE